MSFCSSLQRHLHNEHPNWSWRVTENPDPSTSVIILAQGQSVPGEVIISVFDDSNAKCAEEVVGGQAYCDYVVTGKTEADFARETGARILRDAALV